jgi:hypothetical protein
MHDQSVQALASTENKIKGVQALPIIQLNGDLNARISWFFFAGNLESFIKQKRSLGSQ